MPKIWFLKGLPASGKSTFAREEVAKNPHGTVRVNKDDLRAMCHNSVWGKDNEKLICNIRDDIIIRALKDGKNVIVDDTNFEPKHLDMVRDAAGFVDKPYSLEVKFFDTPLEECIERDRNRINSVGEEVIRGMYEKYLKPTETLPEQDKTLPKAIIVDIDGTVAKMNGRWPHEYHRVSEDLPQEDIINLVRMMYDEVYEVIFLSGRKPSCYKATEEWIKKYMPDIGYSHLYMREDESDNRKDFIFKQEAYEKYIKGKYYVQYVFDDRQQVCDLWRRLWLRCLQVAEWAF